MTRLLRLYPRAWRERYGGELSDLIDDAGLSPRVVFDVARGAAREWAGATRLALEGGTTMVIGPAYRHPTSWAVIGLLVLAPTMIFVLFSILAYQLGMTALVGLMEPVNQWLNGQRIVGMAMVASPAIALLLAAAPLRLNLLNVAIGLLALLVGGLLVLHVLAG